MKKHTLIALFAAASSVFAANSIAAGQFSTKIQENGIEQKAATGGQFNYAAQRQFSAQLQQDVDSVQVSVANVTVASGVSAKNDSLIRAGQFSSAR